MTDTNELILIKHILGDQRVYTDADTKSKITLENSLKHIRGYYRAISKDLNDHEDGFVIIEEEDTGI